MLEICRRLRPGPVLAGLVIALSLSASPTSPAHADDAPPAATAASAAASAPLTPAERARRRLYHPPELPEASQSIAIDNVYSMQILTLPQVDRMEAVGRRMFFDPALSASGKLSCASCHDPAFAYGPPNALDVQLGGPKLDQMGNRAVPSLRYKERLPAFSEHYFDEDQVTGIDQGPTGGFGWDGEFSTAHIQAGLPILAPKEMANAGPTDVAAKLRKADYAAQFRETFGARSLDNDVIAFKWMTLALEYFQRNAAEFYPFTSKYDAFLRGQVALTAQEKHGLEVFNDPEKGNCANCHVSRQGRGGAMPEFTDFGLVAIGVPRNRHLSINKDTRFYDMGLCGPFRSDLSRHSEYCGAFRTPSLRNVALRKTFFHNGSFHDLKQVLEFYNTRDTNPGRWYPRVTRGPHRGEVDKFNDLPPALRKNVNDEVPFKPDAAGKPRLSDNDIEDMMAFLGTLTDGYTPPGK